MRCDIRATTFLVLSPHVRDRSCSPNWFKAKGQISNSVGEGLNNKTKLTIRKSG